MRVTRQIRMAARCGGWALMVSVAMCAAPGTAGAAATTQDAASAQIAQQYGRLPLRFEANEGQTDGQVKFLARGSGFSLFLTGREAVLSLRKPMRGIDQRKSKTDVVKMQLLGGDSKAGPVGIDALPGTTNYLLGNDPAAWHTDVPSYAKVRYAGIYPGVDLVYYGNQRQLEYDFVVAAGADPRPIQLHFAGAKALKLDGDGDLIVQASEGDIAFHKPAIYQIVNGARHGVQGRFTLLAGNSAGFTLGAYDRSRELVIDPTLEYSTYLGGSDADGVVAIALDSAGAAYLTGSTLSSDYPATPGVVQATDKDLRSSAFITKLNASGTALIYSTFLGGSGGPSGGDYGQAIAVDSSGSAYISGFTYSSDYPVTSGAYQKINKAFAESGSTAFVTKINASGTALVYSTFLGGSGTDDATSLALDSSGDVYVAGATLSTDFPVTTGAFQATNLSAPHGSETNFVAKLNPSGASLLYSTYLGGSNDYESSGKVHVAVDSSGDAFVAGSSYSTDYPVTAGVFQPKNNGKPGVDSNLTLSKVNPTGTKLIYSTYLGGTGSSYHGDEVNGFAIDRGGNAYLTGTTYEADYPVTKGALHTTNLAAPNQLTTGYVTKVNPAGTALVFSTYLGGSGGSLGDGANGLAVDGSGDVYITGWAGSTDFPVTGNAYQKTNVASFSGGAVAFLTELNPAGTAEVYSTYFGGAHSYLDMGYGVAVSSSGKIYFAGITSAYDFPISPGAYKTIFNASNGDTGFVAEFTLGSGPTTLPTGTTLTATVNPAVTGTNVGFAASVVPTSGKGVPTGNVVFSIDQVNVATVALNGNGYATYTTKTPLALGQHAILASYAGNTTYTNSGAGITESIVAATPVISPASGIYAAAQLATIGDATPGSTLYYTTDGSTPTSSSTRYNGPFAVSEAETVRAVAEVTGAPNSIVASASYRFVTAPTALAVPASSISTPAATLNALVNTYGMSGSYRFVYGTSATAMTSSTPATPLPSSSFGGRIDFVPVAVSAKVTTLAAKTKYYFQVVVTTAAGTSSGIVQSFTTN